MLRSYRKTEAWDYDVFLAAHIAVLCEFEIETIDAVTDFGNGLRSRKQWPPDAAEVRTACDEFEGPRRRAHQREMLERKQLNERKLIDDRRNSTPRQTVEEMRAELIAKGFDGYGNTSKAGVQHETPESVIAKFGITKEQFDAIPGRNDRCPHCGRLLAVCVSSQNCVRQI